MNRQNLDTQTATVHAFAYSTTPACRLSPNLASGCVLLALLTLVSFGMLKVHGDLAPEVLFHDTFDVASNSAPVNYQYNQGRQSGTAAPVGYALFFGTSQNGAAQLNNSDSPGQLRLQTTPAIGFVSVSLDHDFIEGSRFAVDFDLHVGFDDSSNPSGDYWAGIVLGAERQNCPMTFPDGFGILFRNHGGIQAFDGASQVYGGNGDLPAGLLDNPCHVHIEVDGADFHGSPATIKLFINGVQARINSSASLEYVKSSGFLHNVITLEASSSDLTRTSSFDNLTITAVPGIVLSPRAVDLFAGQTGDPVFVTIPVALNAGQPVQVTVSSSDPSVAVPLGADANGQLTLNYLAGGATVQSFTVLAKAPGPAQMLLSNNQGSSASFPLVVTVEPDTAPELVFADNFNPSGSSFDLNFENGSGRQSGSAGILNYREDPNTTAGGPEDGLTAVNTSAAPGALILRPTIGYVWGSPAHNFLEGSRLMIEFDVNPGANQPERVSGGWAAVIFGASQPGQVVNGSDGVGILFDSNTGMQVFDGTHSVYGGDGGFPGGLPLPPFHVKLDVNTANPDGSASTTVTMYVNGRQARLTPGSLELTHLNGFQGNFITLEGWTGGGEMDSVFDNLKVFAFTNAPPSVNFSIADPWGFFGDQTPAAFNFVVLGTLTSPLNVDYALGGTAINGSDYATLPGLLTIPTGQHSGQVQVVPAVSPPTPGTKTVTLALAPGAGYGVASAQVLSAALLQPGVSAGYLRRELYTGIPGVLVNSLLDAATFPASPDKVDAIDSIASGNLGFNYGQRLSGLLVPPVTGNYLFYISSDDQSVLFLSTDDTPANRQLIAFEPEWNNSRDWTSFTRRDPALPENRSDPISLQAGQRYYFEILHKQGGGGDDVEVTWQKPGDPVPVNGSDPIPGDFLVVGPKAPNSGIHFLNIPFRGPNGHVYKAVWAPNILWSDAEQLAEQDTGLGLIGHLATINDYSEDLFLEKLRRGAALEAGLAYTLQQFWIGGFQLPNQAYPNVGWSWVNDEDPISGVNGGPTYSNWLPNEPNDWGNTIGIEDNEENQIAIGWNGHFGWNDANPFNPSGGIFGYIVEFDTVPIVIDIKPGSSTNPINLGSRGQTPVAVLTTDNFDARRIAPETVRFGHTGTEAAPAHYAWEDVNGDGRLDLILQFNTAETGILPTDVIATLTGQTTDGLAVLGSDRVTPIP
ncbi:MAG: PA14 domain-containing protein [Limisphaerales bacterium]